MSTDEAEPSGGFLYLALLVESHGRVRLGLEQRLGELGDGSIGIHVHHRPPNIAHAATDPKAMVKPATR